MGEVWPKKALQFHYVGVRRGARVRVSKFARRRMINDYVGKVYLWSVEVKMNDMDFDDEITSCTLAARWWAETRKKERLARWLAACIGCSAPPPQTKQE